MFFYSAQLNNIQVTSIMYSDTALDNITMHQMKGFFFKPAKK